MMQRYRIVMDSIDDLPEAYYGAPEDYHFVNQYIYWRVHDKKRALRFSRNEAISLINDMRAKGYPAHAVPSFKVTYEY